MQGESVEDYDSPTSTAAFRSALHLDGSTNKDSEHDAVSAT